ncbi:MAG: hypothetical protein BZY88_03705 [SAR202 cluster bacterium Io17-Chloro-G9]|nr:MAG: hypothetical protein BZY88_03705 [SAR202 cluster bacterium Io17-Chloro-G9]
MPSSQAGAPVSPLPAGSDGITLSGRVQWDGLASLFAERNQPVQTEVDQVSVLTLTGEALASQSDSATFEFRVAPGEAYLLKVRTAQGVNLWGLTSMLTDDTILDVSLAST